MKEILESIYDVIWSPALVVLLLVSGLVFTIGTRFVQIRKFTTMTKCLFRFPKNTGKNQISSFNAFCVCLAGCVGTGNIVGVATAIAIGGPGSVFWMWLAAIVGAATSFAETTLSQLYKFKDGGLWRGGPFSYIEKGLKCKWLSVLYAAVMVVSIGICCASVQSNGMTSAICNTFGGEPVWVGIAQVILVALVVLGGVKRISKVASVVAPFMAFAYIGVTFIILFFNRENIPAAFQSIFRDAFEFSSAAGGIFGATVSMGVRRGLFSNEAGMGTAAVPSASADVEHPVQQGLAQTFSVYIDTLLICTGTALMILTTGSYNIVDPHSGQILTTYAPELGNNYVAYTQAAIDGSLPGFGRPFVSVALSFFVFTTLMAYYFYIETSAKFLTGKREGKTGKLVVRVIQVVFLCSILVGSVMDADFVWTLADIGVGSMTWINLIAILLLCPKVFAALRDFENGRK